MTATVGAGLSIDPVACLGPDRKDARPLLMAWFVKKSFWWMFFGGAACAAIVHAIERVGNEYQVRLSSPDSVLSGLLSAFALVVVALRTHHVRQVPLDRVAPGPSWWRRADPILDVVSVVAVIGFFVTTFAIATIQVS